MLRLLAIALCLVAGVAQAQVYNPTTGGGGGGTGCLVSGGGGIVLNDGAAGCTTDTSIQASGGALSLGSSGVPGSAIFGNATSGTITLQPVTGALGAVTLSLPAATDTLVGKSTTDILSNKTLVSPALGTPASGVLTNTTGLPISTGVSGLGAGVATFLATPSSVNLLTAVTDETGSGALVFATSPTLVTPLLGTPTSGVATNLTGLPLTTGVTGVLPVANGGTNLSSGTSGGVLAYTAAGVLASSGALTANLPVIGGGAGVVPTVGTRSGNTTAFVTTTGTQTSGDCVKIDASGNHIANGSACGGGGGSGTVTSVGLSVPGSSLFGVTGTPVTVSGTLGLTTTGTSGGIPYFSSASAMSSSGVMTANAFVTGGGAATSPNAVAITGLVKGNGASAPAAYAGTSCTNQFPRSLDLNGAATCASVANADLAGSIDLTTKVTGILPIGNGGTGASSLSGNGAVIMNSGGTAQAVVAPGTSGNVLTSNGTVWASSPQGAGGTGSVAVQAFTASGTYTPVAGISYAVAECVGSGGGGGGAAASATGASSGGGGASGSYARVRLTAAQIGASQTVTVGAAGTGGATGANGGTTGSDVSLGTLLICKGGQGAAGGTSNGTGAGGAGVAGSTGDFVSVGQAGGIGVAATVTTVFGQGGAGGSSFWGGNPIVASVAGGAANGATAVATAYGAGGGGGASAGSASTAAGGDGAKGAIVITEFVGGLGGGGAVSSGTATQLAYYASTGTTVSGNASSTVVAGALSLGASGTAGSVKMGNATSGTITLQPVTGALGAVTASLPANTGTIAELNFAQTWTAAQTFGSVFGGIITDATTTRTLVAADCGQTINFTSGSAITVTTANLAVGCHVVIRQGGAGQVTIAAGGGTTIVSASAWTKTRVQYSKIGLSIIATTVTDIDGDGA